MTRPDARYGHKVINAVVAKDLRVAGLLVAKEVRFISIIIGISLVAMAGIILAYRGAWGFAALFLGLAIFWGGQAIAVYQRLRIQLAREDKAA